MWEVLHIMLCICSLCQTISKNIKTSHIELEIKENSGVKPGSGKGRGSGCGV